MTYAGLPRATTDFLAGLAAHNDREWFAANAAAYQAHWVNAGLDLVAALAAPCADLGLMAVPQLNASLRRIHRDVRFSKDKRPYEPRLHLILSTGPAFNKVPGVHLVLSAAGLGYGAGQYGLDPVALDAFRQRVVDPSDREALMTALDQATRVGAALDPPDLARVPKGYDAAPWDGLLRRKSVIVRTQSEVATPDWVYGKDAVDGWMAIIAALVPVTRWLASAR